MKMDWSRNYLASSQIGLLTSGIGIGIVMGWILRARFFRMVRNEMKGTREMGIEAHDDGKIKPEFKLVLVIRNDLKMGKGKAAAQCSHASVFAYQQVSKHPKMLNLWRMDGQKKVVVKVDSEKELLDVEKSARQAGLITSLIRDAGHTQVASGSKTVVGIGPGPVDIVDKVTGHLKLY